MMKGTQFIKFELVRAFAPPGKTDPESWKPSRAFRSINPDHIVAMERHMPFGGEVGAYKITFGWEFYPEHNDWYENYCVVTEASVREWQEGVL